MLKAQGAELTATFRNKRFEFFAIKCKKDWLFLLRYAKILLVVERLVIQLTNIYSKYFKKVVDKLR